MFTWTPSTPGSKLLVRIVTNSEEPIDERVTDAESNNVEVKVEETAGKAGVTVEVGWSGVGVENTGGVGVETLGIAGVATIGGLAFPGVAELALELDGGGMGVVDSGLALAAGSGGLGARPAMANATASEIRACMYGVGAGGSANIAVSTAAGIRA